MIDEILNEEKDSFFSSSFFFGGGGGGGWCRNSMFSFIVIGFSDRRILYIMLSIIIIDPASYMELRQLHYMRARTVPQPLNMPICFICNTIGLAKSSTNLTY